MKKFILLALAFANTAFAAEVTVLEAQLPYVDSFYSRSDASFQMDKTSGQGFALVEVYEDRRIEICHYDQWGRCFPQRNPMPWMIFSQKVKIEGLNLVEKKIVYKGAEGEILCGKMTVSRVFKRPVVKLNGNCKLHSRISGSFNNSKITVTLKTK